MKTPILTRTIVAFCLAALPLTSHAASYEISWVGASGYSMTGMFSYSDSQVNTDLINSSYLNTFSITGFLNKVPLGSFQLGQAPINFNFDTKSRKFVTGGHSKSTSGQEWNIPATNGGFGFFSGGSFQGLHVNGQFAGKSKITIGSTVSSVGVIDSTLIATETPEPSTLVLLGTGLLGFLGSTWYKKKKVKSAPET